MKKKKSAGEARIDIIAWPVPKRAGVDFSEIWPDIPFDFQLRYCNTPDGFEQWARAFVADHKGTFNFLRVNLPDESTGHAPESPTKKHLSYWILRECYDAAHFVNISQEKRRNHREAVEEIKDRKGRSPLKALKQLQSFLKRYRRAGGRIADYWIHEIYGSRPVLPERLMKRPKANKGRRRGSVEVLELPTMEWTMSVDALKQTLTVLERAMKSYARIREPNDEEPKEPEVSAWPYAGPLSFPQPSPMVKERKNAAADGLIFGLALLIRRYMAKKPPPPPMELPSRGRLDEQNEIISELVRATLKDEHITADKVKERLKSLLREGAKYIEWEHSK